MQSSSQTGNSSSNTDGHAVHLAHSEKHARYPPKMGIACWPAAIEVFGRASDEFVSLIEYLVAAAAQHDSAFALPAVCWRRKWEAQLAATVQKAVAQNVIDALGSAASRPPGGIGP